MGKHALVFGASGIIRWALVNELLSDSPDARLFSRVTALTNRPLALDVSQWLKRDKFSIVSGINLLKGSQEELQKRLRAGVPDINTVTHVYFNSYKWCPDPKEESQTNMTMLDRHARAIDALSPEFEYLVLPTGTKAYGIHLMQDFPWKDRLPLSEKLPRLPEPHASELFYYWQVDALNAISEGKKWTWCEARPDLVVGFVPNNNAQCIAQIMAIHLSLFAHINGKGSKVPWPGTSLSYNILSSETSQVLLASFCIWASLNPERTGGGQAFNVVDSNAPSTWGDRWSLICSLFGLEGTGYDEQALHPSEFVKKHQDTWDAIVKDKSLKSDIVEHEKEYPMFFDTIVSLCNFDHHISSDFMYEIGFKESWDERQTWSIAFEKFRMAKIIP